jgi:plasmid stabilization system protein ParE
MDYKLFWTDEAIRNLEEIYDYLDARWTKREVDIFKTKLSKQIDLIIGNPKLFPVSTFQPRLRKAVLSKQTSIFYEVNNDTIFIAYIFVSHKSTDKLK